MRNRIWQVLALVAGVSVAAGARCACAAEAAAPAASPSATQGTMPFSDQPDTYERPKKRLFPIMSDKMEENIAKRGNTLPPPFGVMYITNWMDSDWKFQSASVSLGNSPYIDLDAAENATMDLQVQSNGGKADLWLFPFLDLMIGAGKVDVDAQLGLRDIPISYTPGIGGGTTVRGDAIIPMKFDGNYYSIGGVLAGAYKRFYGAVDFSWVKTDFNSGDASLSTSGFWTFTAAPKFGYNAGLSQIYIGARYISKNEHYTGTVPLASGHPLSFDVKISTDSWVGNFGLRTVIREHWEVLMESAIGTRYQITGGFGYRW
jgi:hypothetical protein